MTTLEKINEISEILQQFQAALSDHMNEQKSRRKELQKDINKLGMDKSLVRDSVYTKWT